MKRLTSFLVLAFLLVAGCTQTAITGEATTDDKLVIGVIAPFSGENAAFGQAIREGVEIARKELPDDVVFIYQDDQLDNAQAVSALKQLIDADDVDAVVGFSSGSGHAVGSAVVVGCPAVRPRFGRRSEALCRPRNRATSVRRVP